MHYDYNAVVEKIEFVLTRRKKLRLELDEIKPIQIRSVDPQQAIQVSNKHVNVIPLNKLQTMKEEIIINECDVTWQTKLRGF